MDVCENLVVVDPCWSGEVDGRSGFRKELGKEGSAEVDGARAGDGLEGYHLAMGVSNAPRQVGGNAYLSSGIDILYFP